MTERDPTSTPAVAGGLPFDASQIQFTQATVYASGTLGAHAQSFVSVKDAPFNAKGDGVTDDTAAIQAAINSLGTKGGTILFPGNSGGVNTIYQCASSLLLDDTVGIVLQGQGSISGGASASAALRFSGTATSISAKSTTGFVCRQLALWATNAAHVGYFIDLDHSGTGSDSQQWLIERCAFIGSSATGTMLGCVNTNRAIIGVIRECYFTLCPIGILGRETNAAYYCNAIQVIGNQFAGIGTMPIRNPGQAWLIQGNTFENLSSGNVGAIDTQIGVPFVQAAVSIVGNWFGDGNATGTWISMCGSALAIRDNYISTGAVGISIFNGGNVGVIITGNIFNTITTAVDFNSVGCIDAFVWGNAYNTVTNRLVNTSAVAGSSVTQALIAGSVHKRVTVAYSAAIVIDTSFGDEFDITATNNTAFTLGVSNPVDGQRITVTIRNASGGVMGAITWSAAFKMLAFTVPTNGNSCSIDFRYDGTNFVQVSPQSLQIPN